MMPTFIPNALREKAWWKRLLGHVLEILILATLFTLMRMVYAWVSKELVSSGFASIMMGADLTRGSLFSAEMHMTVIPTLFILGPAIVFSRVLRRRTLFYLFAIGIPTLVFSLAILYKTLPVYHAVRADLIHQPEMRTSLMIPVPIFLPFIRPTLEILLPFLFGLYCSRHGYRAWKFGLGFVASGAVLQVLFYGTSIHWFFQILEPALLMVVGLAALSLPLQRAAFERLFGLSLVSGPVETPRNADAVIGSFIGHGAVIVFLLLSVFFVFFGFYERKAVHQIHYGAEPPYRSPALVNAYPTLKALFSKKTSPMIPVSQHISEPMHSVYPCMGATMPPAVLIQLLRRVNREESEELFHAMEPYFSALEEASRADYCYFHEPDSLALPHFLNLREAARLLALRATIRMDRKEFNAALDDIELILKTGWLLNEDGQILVTYMIGTSIRRIGISVAANYFLNHLDDPDALALLEARLPGWQSLLRMEFDFEKFKRGEPGFWTLSPFFEIVVPGLLRGRTLHYYPWVQYDYLLLGLALEKYKTAHGDYPEALETLCPDWIERLPLDPYEGKPYGYEREGEEYRLFPLFSKMEYPPRGLPTEDFPPRKASDHLLRLLEQLEMKPEVHVEAELK